MKTEYVQTDFAEITPTIKRAWEIKSHARGKNLIPLAKGEKPPQEPAEGGAAVVDVTTVDSTTRSRVAGSSGRPAKRKKATRKKKARAKK